MHQVSRSSHSLSEPLQAVTATCRLLLNQTVSPVHWHCHLEWLQLQMGGACAVLTAAMYIYARVMLDSRSQWPSEGGHSMLVQRNSGPTFFLSKKQLPVRMLKGTLPMLRHTVFCQEKDVLHVLQCFWRRRKKNSFLKGFPDMASVSLQSLFISKRIKEGLIKPGLSEFNFVGLQEKITFSKSIINN